MTLNVKIERIKVITLKPNKILPAFIIILSDHVTACKVMQWLVVLDMRYTQSRVLKKVSARNNLSCVYSVLTHKLWGWMICILG